MIDSTTRPARMEAKTVSPVSKTRRVTFTVLASVFAAAAAIALFGIGVIVGWFDTEMGGIHRVHDVGYGILYGVILTVALVALTRRPASRPSAWFQVAATAVAATIGALASADPRFLVAGISIGVAALVLLAVHPSRSSVLRPSLDPSPTMATIALAGSVPLVWFGLSMAALQRRGPAVDPHVKMDHWANTAAMAFGIVLVALLASMRLPGWRLSAWCAAIGAAVYGFASIVFHRFPGSSYRYPASEGVGWGVVAIVGACIFIAAAEWEAAKPADAPVVGDERRKHAAGLAPDDERENPTLRA